MFRDLLLLSAALVMMTGCSRRAHETQPFTWRGTIPAGQWIHLRDLNGDILVVPSASSQVEIVATQRWHGRKPRMSYMTNTDASGMYVCAIWGRRGTCSAREYKAKHRWWERIARLRGSSDAEVNFVVRLPAGVQLDASTVNGDVTVRGAGGNVIASSVNGDVEATTANGGITATTVNGDALARLVSVSSGKAVKVTTVTGDAVIEMPADARASVSLSTVTGEVRTEFPVAMTSNRHGGPGGRVQGSIAGGGLSMTATTVTGDVRLRRLGAAGT